MQDVSIAKSIMRTIRNSPFPDCFLFLLSPLLVFPSLSTIPVFPRKLFPFFKPALRVNTILFSSSLFPILSPITIEFLQADLITKCSRSCMIACNTFHKCLIPRCNIHSRISFSSHFRHNLESIRCKFNSIFSNLFIF